MKKRMISVLLTFTLCLGLIITEASAVTSQNAVSWLREQENAYYNLDGQYGAQCSDFTSAYMNWLIDGNPYSGRYGVYHAYYYPTVAGWNPERWEVIPNTPEFIPQPGDIFVTKGGAWYGHTGVVISSTVSRATVIDQNSVNSNEVTGSPARIHDIVWTGSYAATYYIRYRNYEVPCNHNYLNCIEADHPHRSYRYCVDCGDTQYTGATQYSAGCSICNPPKTSTQWSEWSEWSTTSPENISGREIETRETVLGYNLAVYVTQEASYPYRRNFRNYSVNGNYSGYGLRVSYGEFAYRRYATKAELEAAPTCQQGTFVYQDWAHVGGTYKGSGQAYYFPDGYYWYIDSVNTVTEYRFRDRIS